MMDPLLFFAAAFSAGLATVPSRLRPRIALGLGFGACATHWGWCLHYLPLALEQPALWLDFRAGYAVSFLPVGVLLATRNDGQLRDRGLCALPLVIAIARLGCLPAGCCGPTAPLEAGLLGGFFWGLATLGSTPGVTRVSPRLRAGLSLAAVGIVRVGFEPFRVMPPLGAPWLPATWPPLLWIAGGLWIALRDLSVPRVRPCPSPMLRTFPTASRKPFRSLL